MLGKVGWCHCECWACVRQQSGDSKNLSVTGNKQVILINKRAHSQLTVVSFDAFGGAEALPSVDVAHAGVVVTLAGCREQRQVKNVLEPLAGESRCRCVVSHRQAIYLRTPCANAVGQHCPPSHVTRSIRHRHIVCLTFSG